MLVDRWRFAGRMNRKAMAFSRTLLVGLVVIFHHGLAHAQTGSPVTLTTSSAGSDIVMGPGATTLATSTVGPARGGGYQVSFTSSIFGWSAGRTN
jgi:hypothetical protein